MSANIQQILQGSFGVSPSKAEELLLLFEPQQLAKQQMFFKKQQYNVSLAFITEGYIRIYDNHDGKEITQWISGPGDLITDILGLVFDHPNRWNAVALTDVKLSILSHTKYKELPILIPEWPELEKQFISKCFRILEERVFTFISLSAKDRYELFVESKPNLAKTIPLQHLASLLGITPETLSRIRARKY